MITFKQYLDEGKTKSTTKFGSKRANSHDIRAALNFVSDVIGIPSSTLQQDLIGSTVLTFAGKKKDSGDIDIALAQDQFNPIEINQKMMKAVNNEGGFQSGSKIGSYAVPIGNKKVQVDLMFVKNKDWAKFIYHSSGDSKYPGAVRNIILFTALAHTQVPGKDFVIRDKAGKAIVRASHSIHLDSGMQRLFKFAKINSKTGKRNKTLDSVSPNELEDHLKTIDQQILFSHDTDHTDDPNKIAEFIFGSGVSARDIMSAEDVIKHIKNLKNSKEILAACKSELSRLKLPVPKELT